MFFRRKALISFQEKTSEWGEILLLFLMGLRRSFLVLRIKRSMRKNNEQISNAAINNVVSEKENIFPDGVKKVVKKTKLFDPTTHPAMLALHNLQE